MNIKKSLLALYLLLAGQFLYAQKIQVSGVDFHLTTASFYSCDAVPFTVSITNNGTAQAYDVKFTLHSDDITLTPDNFVLSVIPSSQTNYYYDAASGVFWLSEPLLAGQTLSVIIPVKINCSILSQPVVPANINVAFTASVAGEDNPIDVNVPVNTSSSCSASAGADKSICPDAATQLNAIGGGTYSWSPADNLSNPNIANPIATVNAATTYTVVVTNANGCKSIDQVVINMLPRFYINGGYDHSTCPGATFSFNPGSAVSYSWSPATGLSNPNIANPVVTASATSIIYTLTATNAAGCKATDEVFVNILPAPTINAGSDKVVCIGSSITLMATGAATYSWSPEAGLSDYSIPNPIANPTVTTTYTVTGSSPGFLCSGTDQIKITVSPLPAVNAGPDRTICSGNEEILNVSGAASYVWFPGTGLSDPKVPNPVVTLSGNITYTVTGTSINGCKNTDVISITAKPSPLVDAGVDQTICQGSAATINVKGAGPFTFFPAPDPNPSFWNTTVHPSATTTYTLVSKTVNGCAGRDNITINVKPLPVVNAGDDQAICEPNGSVQMNATGAQSYSWSPANGLSNAKIANPTAKTSGMITYTVTGTTDGCSATDKVIVRYAGKPNISAGQDWNVCEGSTRILQATGGVSYVWTPAETLSDPNIANPIATPVTETTYTVTGTNEYGCSNTDEVTLRIWLISEINAGPDQTICEGQSVTLHATGGTYYGWDPGVPSEYTYSAIAIVSPKTTTSYKVDGTKTGRCPSSDNVVVYVNPKPTVDAGIDRAYCSGGSARLNATGALSYSWMPIAGLSNPNVGDPTANPTALSTTYTVTGTDANGCKNTDKVQVFSRPTPVVNAGTDRTVCDDVILSATSNVSGGTVLWTTDHRYIEYPDRWATVVSPSLFTKYKFTQTVAYGGSDPVTCSGTDEVVISAIPYPVLKGPVENMHIDLVYIPDGIYISNYTWYLHIPGESNLHQERRCDYKSTCSGSAAFGYEVDVEYRSINSNLVCVHNSNWLGTLSKVSERMDELPLETSGELITYPVPAENTLTVEFNSESATIVEIGIDDMLGTEVLRAATSGNQSQLDVSSLPSGIYILRLKDSKGEFHVRRVEVKK